MDQVTVEVRGIDELNAGTRTLFRRIGEAAPAAFENVAERVADQVRGSVPHRTGRLAGSVEAQQTRDGAQVGMGQGIRYAVFVEYGGRGFPHSSTGNYLYPVATDAGPYLQDAGEKVAAAQIGAMHWPSP
jgi:hypothetical protein